MKLEEIDTSTTAGKARVMQLAAEGRKVVFRARRMSNKMWFYALYPQFDWEIKDYAIIRADLAGEVS